MNALQAPQAHDLGAMLAHLPAWGLDPVTGALCSFLGMMVCGIWLACDYGSRR